MSFADGADGADGAGEVLACALCGARVSGAAVPAARLSWARGVERGDVVWTCDGCARTHLRSIEGKLDSAWW